MIQPSRWDGRNYVTHVQAVNDLPTFKRPYRAKNDKSMHTQAVNDLPTFKRPYRAKNDKSMHTQAVNDLPTFKRPYRAKNAASCTALIGAIGFQARLPNGSH
jgi:hypothetical protein